MSADLVILVPVLNRPRNAQPLIDSIHANTTIEVRVLFICSPRDRAEQHAAHKTGADTCIVPWEPGHADWAKKLEYGRHHTTEPLMLLAADDLSFHPNWDVNALRRFDTVDIGVLGTQDLGNAYVKRGQHSTHPIVCRGYADQHGTVDDPTLMMHQGYEHQFCDNELCETAMARGCWAFARDCVIEHLHPAWKKASWDDVYEKGSQSFQADYRLFCRRRPLWNPRRSRRIRQLLR